jgi:hypothetical protein
MNSEKLLRQVIREKIRAQLTEQRKNEQALRSVIRRLIQEGDLSDIHPHRSTGINSLEDVLKKSIPTLRTDFKRLTTDKSQRESFRAHIVKAVKDSLAPEMIKGNFGSEGGMVMAAPEEETTEEPPEEEVEVGDEEEEADEGGDAELDAALDALQEVEIDISDEEKKIPVEKDDEPTPQEQFGSGLEGLDETGRNMAYTSFRKISQYILDAFDSLANPKDKQVFHDYLITNLKLYFDKFEDELQSTVTEPTTKEYDSAKSS